MSKDLKEMKEGVPVDEEGEPGMQRELQVQRAWGSLVPRVPESGKEAPWLEPSEPGAVGERRGGPDSGQAQTLRATGRTLAPTMSEMGALRGFGTEERPLICVLTGPLGLGWVTGCGDPWGAQGPAREALQ